jgi:hypothetical protein
VVAMADGKKVLFDNVHSVPDTNSIPEPSTMLLSGTDLKGLALWRCRKNVKS